MKLIELHKKWLKQGYIVERGNGGLCNNIPEQFKDTLSLFTPTYNNHSDLRDGHILTVYWGYGLPHDGPYHLLEIATKYTPLRQTIILLICAMHNEL